MTWTINDTEEGSQYITAWKIKQTVEPYVWYNSIYWMKQKNHTSDTSVF